MRYGTEQTEAGTYHLTRTHEDGSFDAVRVPELFPPPFMQAHTAYSSFDALLSDSDMDVRTKQDFVEMSSDEKDRLVARQTPFEDWKDMQDHAWKARRS